MEIVQKTNHWHIPLIYYIYNIDLCRPIHVGLYHSPEQRLSVTGLYCCPSLRYNLQHHPTFQSKPEEYLRLCHSANLRQITYETSPIYLHPTTLHVTY